MFSELFKIFLCGNHIKIVATSVAALTLSLPALSVSCDEIIKLNFGDGTRSTIRSLEKLMNNDPGRQWFFVAIYGFPGSGKSTLIKKIADHFRSDRMHVFEQGGHGPTKKIMEIYREFSDMDKLFSPLNQKTYLVLMHLTSPRGYPLEENVLGPNEATTAFFNQKVDLHIGIYGAKRVPYEGIYNFLILNDEIP